MAGRSVAITGAGGGIGRAVAEAFVASGDRVFLADTSEERLAGVVASLPAGAADGRVVDVTDFASVEAFVAGAQEATGRLDVFVSNAGIFDGCASVTETSPELWHKVLAVNLTGCFHGVKAASVPMLAQGGGRIVTIGSIAARRGLADGLAYTTTKAGIEGLNRRLAFDLAGHGITANVVAPGAIDTQIRANSEEVLGSLVDVDRGVGASAELMDLIVPTRRKGTPAEVAATVHFLAGDAAAYITGQVLYVDGGWFAS